MIIFSPLFASPFFELALAALLAAGGFSIYKKRSRGILRALFALLFALVISNPTISIKDTKPLSSIIALIVDRSSSQNLSIRAAQTDQLVAEIKKRIETLGSFETRLVEITDKNDDGTRLFAPLRDTLADAAPERIGGAILISDGVVEDVPKDKSALGFNAPLHALVTGYTGERDRRIALLDSPPFGLVNRDLTLRVKVTDPGKTDLIPLTLNKDGKLIATIRAKPGDTVSLPLRIDHADHRLPIERKAEA